MKPLYDAKSYDLYTVKADAMDEEGMPRFRNGAYGGSSGHSFEKSRALETKVRYQDRIFFCDVYHSGSETMVHLYCPKCLNAIQILSSRKALEWDPVDSDLSVEPMECPWEVGRGTDGTASDRIAFGLGLCRFKFAIDHNIVRAA